MLLNLSVSLKARFQTSKAIKHLLANLLATSVSLLPAAAALPSPRAPRRGAARGLLACECHGTCAKRVILLLLFTLIKHGIPKYFWKQIYTSYYLLNAVSKA